MNSILIPAITCFIMAAASFGLLWLFERRGIISPRKMSDRVSHALLCFALPSFIIVFVRLVLGFVGFAFADVSVAFSLVFSAVCIYIITKSVLGVKFEKTEACEKIKRFLRYSVRCLAVMIILEISVFNFSAYDTLANKDDTDALSVQNTAECSGYVSNNNGEVRFTSDEECTVTYTGFDKDIDHVGIALSSLPHKVAKVKISVMDKNRSMYYQDAGEGYVTTNGEEHYFNVYSYGTKSLKISVKDGAGVALDSVTVDPQIPIKHNDLRIIILCGVALIICAVVAFSLHRVTYNKHSFAQFVIILVCVMMCLSVCLGLTLAGNDPAFTDYNKGDNVAGAAPYVQLFDAFQKGQTNLDIPVDEKLANAGELAYDSQYRTANGISFTWDRAFKDGKYYCYYGASPVILLYYPCYIVSHKLPTNRTACGIFAMLFVAVGFLLIFELAKRINKNPNFLLTLLLAVALPFATCAVLILSFGDLYCIPILCGMLLLELLVLFTIKASNGAKWYWYLLCGVCVPFIVAARPPLAFIALTLAPFYIKTLADKELCIKRKLACVAAFALPLIVGAALIMKYNFDRFGDVLEFGSNYQLTVDNIFCNNFSFSYLPMALYHTLFQPCEYTGYFPYVAPLLNNLGNYARYMYCDPSFGLFNMPLYLGAFAAPLALKKREKGDVYKWLIILTFIAVPIIAVMDFSMCGVCLRYLTDISPMLYIAVALIIMMLARRFEGTKAQDVILIITAAAVILTVIFSVIILCLTNPQTLKRELPDVFGALSGIFMI